MALTGEQLDILAFVQRYTRQTGTGPLDERAATELSKLWEPLGFTSQLDLLHRLQDEPFLTVFSSLKTLLETGGGGDCPDCPECPPDRPNGDPITFFGGGAGYFMVSVAKDFEYAWLPTIGDLNAWGAGSSTPGWYFYDGVAVSFLGAGPTTLVPEIFALNFDRLFISPSGTGAGTWDIRPGDGAAESGFSAQWDTRLRFGKVYPGVATWTDGSSFNYIEYP